MSSRAFHPELASVARLLPYGVVRSWSLGPARALGRWAAAWGSAPVEEMEVAAGVRVRLHLPERSTGAAVLWVHGGGLVIGSARQDDARCAWLARELGAVVAAVGYRLAPEHPFPAGLDDVVAAARWLAARPGVDAIALVGISAGGGLAAAAAQRLRDEGGPPLTLQVLVYPMLDDRSAAGADPDAAWRRVWDREANAIGWASYLGRPPGGEELPPYAAPARRVDLSGLAPAWIGVGDLDLFYAESVDYARRLGAAGVGCQLEVVAGAFHGFDEVAPKAQVSLAFRASALAALRRAFAKR